MGEDNMFRNKKNSEKSERKNNKQLRTAEGSDARRSDRDCNRKA